MNQFLIYEHNSGEVIFIKRDAITSFAPKYISPRKYTVMVTVAKESYPIKDAESMEDAKAWIMEQISQIESVGSEPTRKPK